MIEFIVLGTPKPRGSKFAVRGKRNGKDCALIVDDCRQSGAWMKQIAEVARAAYDGPLIQGPIEASFQFYIARPKVNFGTGRNRGSLKSSAPYYHQTRPDLAKLIRCAEDALTGILWKDDGQICRYADCGRHWTMEDESMVVAVRELT